MGNICELQPNQTATYDTERALDPSGVNTMPITLALWPVKESSSAPVLMSQTIILQSCDPLTTTVSFKAAVATHEIPPSCPTRTWVNFPVEVSQIFNDIS
ncbi:hypothetical protein QR98_0059300 [Sarcoptes scabiei]|uniref:Uncharacterized protein n=1 Tax=Sarcoptes scabiei TaxID=52283 RepID=A0A132A8X3_SARSC|nr:hypothetical protein QR98_0059300 [Sarcoptes scabiei]